MPSFQTAKYREIELVVDAAGRFDNEAKEAEDVKGFVVAGEGEPERDDEWKREQARFTSNVYSSSKCLLCSLSEKD